MPLARIDSTKGLIIDNQSGSTGNLVPPTGTSSQLTAGDGTAVTVGSGLSLAGAMLTASGGWQTTYEVDFTTLTPVASYSNGTATIDGKTWTFAQLGATSSASLSAANGLQLVCNSGNTTGARTTVLLSNLGAFPGPNSILVWTRMSSTVSLGNGYSMTDTGIGTATGPAATTYNYAFVDRRGYLQLGGGGSPVATNFFAPRGYLDGTTYPNSDNAQYSTTNTNHDVRVINYVSSNIAQVWSGSWSSGWPAFSSLQFRGLIMLNVNSYSNTSAALIDPSNVNYIAAAYAESVSVSNTIAKLLNLRVQVK